MKNGLWGMAFSMVMALSPIHDAAAVVPMPKADTTTSHVVKSDPQQTNKTVERYRANWLNITYGQNGDINFTFNATSVKDTALRDDGKEYATGSGDLTVLQLRVEDDAFGTFGNTKADVRVQFTQLEFTDPYNSNYANVRFVINTKTGTINKVMAVQPEAVSETPPYDVNEIIVEGTNVRVTLNGDNTGQHQNTANRIVQNTKALGKDSFGQRSVLIEFNKSYRKIIPQDGQKQLRPLYEIIRPR